jgi:hypothetical protein
MRDETEDEIKEPADALDPYGDVALGVECAWPRIIPVALATPSDLPS